MTVAKTTKILFKRYKLILFAGVLGAVFALVLSLILFPLEYRADAQVLIISQTRLGIDPYTVVKSAERVGENLIQVMKTDDFLNKVLTHEVGIAQKLNFKNLSDRDRRKVWQETVNASVIYGTGVLNISTYSQDPDAAKDIARVVAETLVARGWEYVGGDVVIKIINNPVTTRFPARPNLPLNSFAGFMIGVFVMTAIAVRKFD